MRITSLHTYPVKGCHRLDHDDARIETCGLAGDRRWLIIDADGIGVTQRGTATLVTLRAQPRPGGLVLSTTDGALPALDVAEPADGPGVDIRVFRSQPAVPARLAAAAAHAWLTRLLGTPVRLAWLADPTVRPVDPAHAAPDDRVSFADGYPVLLANTASLAAVNDWLLEAGDEPVPMTRFRPNIVIDGAAPWAEDGWIGRRLRLGDTVLRAAKACDRCVVTTIDQENGDTGRQPLRALGEYRRFPDGLMFGVHLIPEVVGAVRLGEPVHLLP